MIKDLQAILCKLQATECGISLTLNSHSTPTHGFTMPTNFDFWAALINFNRVICNSDYFQ